MQYAKNTRGGVGNTVLMMILGTILLLGIWKIFSLPPVKEYLRNEQYFSDSHGICRLFIVPKKDSALSRCNPTEYDKLLNFTFFSKEAPRMSMGEFKKEIKGKLADQNYKLISLGESHNNNAEQETAVEILETIAQTRKIKSFDKEQASLSIYSTATGETTTGPIDTRVIDPNLYSAGIKIGKSGSAESSYSFCERASQSIEGLKRNEIVVTYTGFAHSTLVLRDYFHEDLLRSGGKLPAAIKECAENTNKYISIVLIEEKSLFDGVVSRILLTQPQGKRLVEKKKFFEEMAEKWGWSINAYPLSQNTYIIRWPFDPDVYFVVVDPGSYYVREIAPALTSFLTLLKDSKASAIFTEKTEILKNCCTYNDLKIDEFHSIPSGEGKIRFPIARHSGAYRPDNITFHVLNDPGSVGEEYQFEIDIIKNQLTRIKYKRWNIHTGVSEREDFL